MVLKDPKGSNDTMFYTPRKKRWIISSHGNNIVFRWKHQDQYLSNYDGKQKTSSIIIDHEHNVLFSVSAFSNLPFLSGIRNNIPDVWENEHIN